jgi:hypothetical protein
VAAHALDERLHATAVKAALDAALAPDVTAYEYGQVPGADGNVGTIPAIYVLLTVERRYLEPVHSPRLLTRTGWRLTVRPVGTTANEARWASLRATQALEGVSLSIGGWPTSVITHESSNPPELLDGKFEALSRFIYAL